MNEEFRDVVGYEGLYKVSNLGRVYSVVSDKFIGHPDYMGYTQVTLCKNGYHRIQRAHCLILEAFVGPRPQGFVIRHLDDNPANNRLDNLQYGTYRENYNDAQKNGHLPLVGNMAKLTPELAIKIANDPAPIKELVSKYGFSYNIIVNIKNGMCYGRVTGIVKHRLKPIRNFTKEEICKIITTNNGQKQLAEELGTSRATIQRIRRTYNLIANLQITSKDDPTLRTHPVLSSTMYSKYVKYFLS